METTITARSAASATIWSVYRPVEAYRELLPAVDEPAYDAAARLQPLDAYLIHLVLSLLPGRPAVVDLAADATWGTTTVLGLTHPRVRTVLVPKAGAASRYRFALERYRAECEPPPAAALEPLPALPGTPGWFPAANGPGLVFLLPAEEETPGRLVETVQPCLEADAEGLVLILGLGGVGQCPAVQGLLEACGVDSSRRFWLLRELGDCLLASRVGLVARRDNALVEDVLTRVRQLYSGNFSFLNLVKKSCLAAMRAADVDAAALKAHHTGWLVENREVVAKLEQSAREETAALKTTLAQTQQAHKETQDWVKQIQQSTRREIAALREEAQRAWQMHGAANAALNTTRQALWDRDQELAAIRSGLGYRLLGRVHRVRQVLIPEGSRRFWLYRKLRRAGHVWRSEGLVRLMGRVARKCWPIKP
jgi:hypothetical protein